MTMVPVLDLPYFEKLFIMMVDQCRTRIGVVFMQGKQPIAYLYQVLNKKNQGLSTYEKELIALL